jgi:hypothetical protein
MDKTITIYKGNKIRKYLFIITGVLLTGLIIVTAIVLSDIFGSIVVGFLLAINIIYIISETLPKIRFRIKSDFLFIKEGIGIFDTITNINLNSIKKIKYEFHRFSDGGGGSASGPFTYNSAFEKSSSSNTKYSIIIYRIDKKRIDVGHYLSKKDLKSLITFFNEENFLIG